MSIKFRPMPAKLAARRVPVPSPVHLPAGYTPPGTKIDLLPWSFVEERLARSHNYWICSTRPDGRPHATPVWGLWLDGAVVFSTDPSSRKARNLRANPSITIHLESGDEAVILEGRVEEIELNKNIDAAYKQKYRMGLIGMPMPMVIFSLRLKLVMAWREKDFSSSATRWQFEED